MTNANQPIEPAVITNNALRVMVELNVNVPNAGPSGLMSVADWTQICEAVSRMKHGPEYIQVLWSAFFGAFITGILTTAVTFLSNLPSVAWIACGLLTAMAGAITLCLFIVDKKLGDSFRVRVESVKNLMEHVERRQPVLAQRLHHPNEQAET